MSAGEFETRFATFTASGRRLGLLATFNRLLTMAKSAGIVSRIVVGGSYVSANPEPNDIDLVIMLTIGVEVGELTPIQYNVARRSALRRVLGTDHLDVIVLLTVRISSEGR